MEKRTRDVIGGALRPNDPRRFLVEAMIGAMNADGNTDARELAILQKHLEQHALFAGVSSAAARTLIELATDAIKFAGSSVARVPMIAKGLPSRIHRITAYAMAVEIATADNVVTDAENAFLEPFRNALRIAHGEAQSVFDAIHHQRLPAHLDDVVLRVRTLVPVAVEMFTLRAQALGKIGDDHRFALRDFFLAMPDLLLAVPDLEGAFYQSFKRPRAADFNVLVELQRLAPTLPDIADRWWMVVYALAAEPPTSVASWRVIPFAALLQAAFGLSDQDMDMAAQDATIFPGVAAEAVSLLVTGIVAAVLVAISLWPPKRPASWAFAMWFPAWLVSELPVHTLVVEIAAVALAIGAGGIDGLGWLGLALGVAAAVGLLSHVRDARRSAVVLAEAVGAPVRAVWRPLAHMIAFPFHPATVERVCDVAYHGRLCLDIYKSPHLRPDAPVFLYVHGGAWVIGNKAQQGRLLAHRLALAGWLVVSIDYRLSPAATFPDHLHDVKRAIAWVRAHAREHGGDPERLVIGGASAGAHLAALAALTPNAIEYQRDFPEVDTAVQGCVCFYGVYDLFEFPNRGFPDFIERVMMKRRRADAVEEFEKASPRFRVGEHAPPFLLLHGNRDSLAPLAGAVRFRDALRAVSRAPVVWAELPGANHAFDLFPSLRADAAVIAVEHFCEKIVALSTVNVPRRDDSARPSTKP